MNERLRVRIDNVTPAHVSVTVFQQGRGSWANVGQLTFEREWFEGSVLGRLLKGRDRGDRIDLEPKFMFNANGLMEQITEKKREAMEMALDAVEGRGGSSLVVFRNGWETLKPTQQ